jgi:hypothetical protein
MTNKLEYRKQWAVFKTEEYEALQKSATEDFRGDAEQLRYLAVQRLRDRGFLRHMPDNEAEVAIERGKIKYYHDYFGNCYFTEIKGICGQDNLPVHREYMLNVMVELFHFISDECASEPNIKDISRMLNVDKETVRLLFHEAQCVYEWMKNRELIEEAKKDT